MEKSTILIVDDQKTIHIVLRALLSELYNLEYAANAQEAIDILRDKSVNLMLLDIEMPQLSGLDLLQSIMIDSVLNKVPVIILTGEATEEREKRARELGAAGFVEKKDIVTDNGKKSFLDLIKENLEEASSYQTKELNYQKVSKSIIKDLIEDAKKK